MGGCLCNKRSAACTEGKMLPRECTAERCLIRPLQKRCFPMEAWLNGALQRYDECEQCSMQESEAKRMLIPALRYTARGVSLVYDESAQFHTLAGRRSKVLLDCIYHTLRLQMFIGQSFSHWSWVHHPNGAPVTGLRGRDNFHVCRHLMRSSLSIRFALSCKDAGLAEGCSRTAPCLEPCHGFADQHPEAIV